MHSFVTGFLCSTFYLWNLPILLCLVVYHSSFLQNSVLLCECTIIYPFTGWWAICVVPSFGLLWMVHYEHWHVCLLVRCVCISTGYILRNGSAGSQRRQMFNFDKAVQHFTKVVVPMYIPISGVRESQWLHIFAKLGIFFFILTFMWVWHGIILWFCFYFHFSPIHTLHGSRRHFLLTLFFR